MMTWGIYLFGAYSERWHGLSAALIVHWTDKLGNHLQMCQESRMRWCPLKRSVSHVVACRRLNDHEVATTSVLFVKKKNTL